VCGRTPRTGLCAWLQCADCFALFSTALLQSNRWQASPLGRIYKNSPTAHRHGSGSALASGGHALGSDGSARCYGRQGLCACVAGFELAWCSRIFADGGETEEMAADARLLGACRIILTRQLYSLIARCTFGRQVR